LPFSDLLANKGAILDPRYDVNFVESDVGFEPENRENNFHIGDDIDEDEDEFVGSLAELAETMTNLTEDGGVKKKVTQYYVHIH
jgi:hypothetical protein